MKNVVAAFLLALLCTSSCSRSGTNALIGTWKSDRDLTMDSDRRDHQGPVGPDFRQLREWSATLAFTSDKVKIDLPVMQIMDFESDYSVVSADGSSVTISLPDIATHSLKTASFHFEGADVMWTQNENRLQTLPITKFRQYYRRVH